MRAASLLGASTVRGLHPGASSSRDATVRTVRGAAHPRAASVDETGGADAALGALGITGTMALRKIGPRS